MVSPPRDRLTFHPPRATWFLLFKPCVEKRGEESKRTKAHTYTYALSPSSRGEDGNEAKKRDEGPPGSGERQDDPSLTHHQTHDSTMPTTTIIWVHLVCLLLLPILLREREEGEEGETTYNITYTLPSFYPLLSKRDLSILPIPIYIYIYI
jgi:hypothetical protein